MPDTRQPLSEDRVESDPVAQFAQWYERAQAAVKPLPHAVALATATGAGHPSLRMVLLKGFDAHGFVFYTNYRSRKGRELARNARASLVFYWGDLPEAHAMSPVAFLADNLYKYCQREGITLLDIGTATDKGMPNVGLMTFKERLGCTPSPKLTCTKSLP